MNQLVPQQSDSIPAVYHSWALLISSAAFLRVAVRLNILHGDQPLVLLVLFTGSLSV